VTGPAPPKIAMYFLARWSSPYHRESLAGDLIEQAREGRSAAWVWRQVLSAMIAARMRAVKLKPWPSIAKTLLRILNAMMLAGVLALGVGTLTRADAPQKICTPHGRC